MPTALPHKVRKLAIVTAVLATLPAALAQQGRPPDTVLPPPSLYDELMPPERAAGPTPATLPASPASAAQSQPAQTMPVPAGTAPAAVTQPTAVTRSTSAPAKQSVEANDPWYKSMFSWTEGGQAQPAQSKMMAAPSPGTATYAAGAAVNEYATQQNNAVVRTGYGKCVRTGWWRGSSSDPCGPTPIARQRVAQPTQLAAAVPIPVARPEPVEVKPLTPAPMREERTLQPEPAAVTVPAPVPAREPPRAAQTMTLSADALFPLSSATLKPTAKERLDELASRVLTMDYKTIRVVGHTDPTGSPQFNDKLSIKRAEEVKRYLVAKGVDPNAIITEGMGSAMPMVTEQDCANLPREKKIACYQPDRRVEVEVIGATQKTGRTVKPVVARKQ